MLSNAKILRMLMVGMWFGFLMLGVYGSNMEEKGGSGCCRGNKETIKLKSQNKELTENMARETDEWKRITVQLESRIEAQTLEIKQQKNLVEDKDSEIITTKMKYQQQTDEWKIKVTQLESMNAEQKKKIMQDKENEINAIYMMYQQEIDGFKTKVAEEKDQFLQLEEISIRTMEYKENELNAIKMKYQQEIDEWKIENSVLKSMIQAQNLDAEQQKKIMQDKVNKINELENQRTGLEQLSEYQIIQKKKSLMKIKPGRSIVLPILTQKMHAPGKLIADMIVNYLYRPLNVATIPYGNKVHSIIGMCLSRDHRLLFMSDTDNYVTVWNLEVGMCVQSFLSPEGSLAAFQLYDGGRALLSQGEQGGVSVFQPTISSEKQKYVREHFDKIEEWMPITQPYGFNYIISDDDRFLLAHTALNRITSWHLPSLGIIIEIFIFKPTYKYSHEIC